MGGVPLIDTNRELIEREQECAVLDTLVDRLRDGGGTVVVRGEAGIGKSALLQRVRRRAEARGIRSLITVGVESEAEFAFAGLHQLLRPVIGALAQLPESQRQALERIGGCTFAGSQGAGAASGLAREGSRRIVRQPPGAR